MSSSTTEPRSSDKPQAFGKPNYEKAEPVLLRNAGYDERWLQDQIAADPSLLGLGDLVLIDRERRQPGAGRLDLLLQEGERNQRYEVEIQLGKSDESHIIRTIEYWDIEKKRYPQYDHTAVLIAEDITSRFLNVVSLFNGFIPIVAIQLNAIMVNGVISLVFTKVLDPMNLGMMDEEVEEKATKEYWRNRASNKTMKLATQCLEIIREIQPGTEFNYTKFYIGLTHDGKVNNFIQLKPQKKDTILKIRIEPSEEINSELESAGISYTELPEDRRNLGYRYQINLKSEERIKEHRHVLMNLFKKAKERE